MKFVECIKFGIGFFIGYEFAKVANEVAKEAYVIARKRIKDGAC